MFYTISQNAYCNVIPLEMSISRINKMSNCLFGIDILNMYAERKIAEKTQIFITEFSSNGFFWAQIKEELVRILD